MSNKYFNTSGPKVVKTISQSPSPRSIPSTSDRRPSTQRPAPLTRPCASCGRKK
jgi:hypothetical protein